MVQLMLMSWAQKIITSCDFRKSLASLTSNHLGTFAQSQCTEPVVQRGPRLHIKLTAERESPTCYWF